MKETKHKSHLLLSSACLRLCVKKKWRTHRPPLTNKNRARLHVGSMGKGSRRRGRISAVL